VVLLLDTDPSLLGVAKKQDCLTNYTRHFHSSRDVCRQDYITPLKYTGWLFFGKKQRTACGRRRGSSTLGWIEDWDFWACPILQACSLANSRGVVVAVVAVLVVVAVRLLLASVVCLLASDNTYRSLFPPDLILQSHYLWKKRREKGSGDC
jgi:hypothetical protein